MAIWQYVFILGLAVIALPGLCPADADTIDAIGELAQTADEPEAEASTIAELFSADRASLSAQQYMQKIRELEFSGGVYQPELAETLAGLGRVYLDLGDLEAAEKSFRRALHTSRVNDGLYNSNQLPILDQLIDVNTVTGDWADLDQSYNYLYWVSKRNYGADDPRLLPVIDRIGRWHLQAYTSTADGQPLQHLLVADEMYNKAIQIVETHYGASDPRLVNALYGMALTNYQMAVLVSDAEKFNEISNGKGNAFGNGRRELIQEARTRDDLMLTGFVKGKNAMERVVAIHDANPQMPVESRAVALVHLADWYLLFNKWNSSQKIYSQAYAVLTDQGLPVEQIDALFAHPRPLPALYFPGNEAEEQQPVTQQERSVEEGRSAEEAPLNQDEPLQAGVPYVLVSFDVSRTGTPRNIKIIESSPPDSTSLQRRARKSVGASKFRPRLSKGVAVDATGIRQRYLFPEH